MEEKRSKKESVSDGAKPTSNCKFSHKINTQEQCEDLEEEGSGDCLDSVTKPTYLPEECNPVNKEKMPNSHVNAKLGRVGRPHQEINEEELKESLKCEMLENCTPQFCCTCQQKFSSQLISNAHYAGKPHKRLLQMKLKVMLRKKVREENLRKKQGYSELINSATIATEIKQIVTDKMAGEKNAIKEETRKRPGDHLDENLCVVDNKNEPVCNLPSNLLGKCQPTYCGVCLTSLNKNDSRPHYAGKPHQKKLKMVEMERNQPQPQPLYPNNYTCSLCQVIATSKLHLEIHRQGSKHKSKEAQQEALRPHSGTKKVKTKQLSGKVAFFCDVCQVYATNEHGLKMHLIGKPHAKKLSFMELNSFVCEVCGFITVDNKSLELHLQGYGHKTQVVKKEEGKKEEGNKSLSEQADSRVSSAVEGKKENQETCIAVEAEKTFTLVANESLSDTESMSIRTAVMMNGSKSEKSVIKDEEMDDGEDKDVPDLSDSMNNLEGYGDIIKNKELKSTLKLKEKELLHPAEIDKTPTSETLKKEDIVLVTENIEVKKSSKGDDEREEAASSDDDLIILETPDSSSPRKSIQTTQNLNNTPLAEGVKLCVYPLGESARVTVSTQDYATLAYDTFLNDIIIDFYLLYLANNVLSNNDRGKVHIFSTMFYKRLLQSPRADAKKVPEYENDVTLTSAEIRHFRVANWTKNVDLFEKDMIIIPICEESHWYLLLVVKPGIIFLPFKTKERKERGEPFMIVLDSVGGRNNAAVKNIRRYLACEWNKKKCDGAELLTSLEQMGKKMNKLRPNKPEQENNSDCGIFLLLYVDKVFQNVSAFLWTSLVNSMTREWFTSEEVAGKRGEIAELIKRLTKEQKPREVIEFPNIKFTAKGV